MVIQVGIAMAGAGALMDFLAIPHAYGAAFDWKLFVPGLLLFLIGLVVGRIGRQME